MTKGRHRGVTFQTIHEYQEAERQWKIAHGLASGRAARPYRRRPIQGPATGPDAAFTMTSVGFHVEGTTEQVLAAVLAVHAMHAPQEAQATE